MDGREGRNTRSRASWQGAARVLGITALVWLGLMLVGVGFYGDRPPYPDVRVENRTGAGIDVRLLGPGRDGLASRVPPGESERLSAPEEILYRCHVLATDAEEGDLVALVRVTAGKDGLSNPVVVGAESRLPRPDGPRKTLSPRPDRP